MLTPVRARPHTGPCRGAVWSWPWMLREPSNSWPRDRRTAGEGGPSGCVHGRATGRRVRRSCGGWPGLVLCDRPSHLIVWVRLQKGGVEVLELTQTGRPHAVPSCGPRCSVQTLVVVCRRSGVRRQSGVGRFVRIEEDVSRPNITRDGWDAGSLSGACWGRTGRRKQSGTRGGRAMKILMSRPFLGSFQ